MQTRWEHLPCVDVCADWGKIVGEPDLKKFSIGIGGINSLPAPKRAIEGIRLLKPQLMRVFIQEFYEVYAGNGVYNWDKLDAFMDSVAAMGTKIMASICIKPPALFPTVDENIWQPNDVAQWQEVIRRMVRRYSVEREYVTHWGIANEVNIGEDGGCPYKIESASDYYAYYDMTLKAVLEAFPDAYVGGPSFAGAPTAKSIGFFDEFISLCEQNGTKLDFLSYNVYTDDPEGHVAGAHLIEEAIKRHKLPLAYFVTEFNVSLIGEAWSIEEQAFDSRRAASHAASILAMRSRTEIAGTFQYHAYDVHVDPREFAPFYERCRFMTTHWNDTPHRLGLFSHAGEVRPQYFVYQMLQAMTGQEVATTSGSGGIHTLAAKDDGKLTVLLVNFKVSGSRDTVARLAFSNLPEGVYRFTVKRIDAQLRWRNDDLTMIPTENRIVYAYPDFTPAVYLPADSVALVTMELMP